MTAACSLLLKADQSVEQIAAAVGYLNSAIFSPISPVPWDDPKAWKNISALATIMLPLNNGVRLLPDLDAEQTERIAVTKNCSEILE